MKGIFLFSLLLISSVALAQQPGVKLFLTDSSSLHSQQPFLESSSFLKMKQPDIKFDDDFYKILQAPNVNGRYTKGSLKVKRPEFIPEMPVAPEKPFSDFYLLDLDTEIIPAKEE